VAAATAAVRLERARISRELHDGVLQTLYAITLTASRGLLAGPNDVANILGEVTRLANGAQSELRAMLTDFRSDTRTGRGLIVELAALGADLRARSGLEIGLSLGDEPVVSATTKEAVLSIAREALYNVFKHADATRVDIVLEVASGEFALQISDDGRGFDPGVLRADHFGLQSMRERAAAVGGALELVSSANNGTQIRVGVPASGA
jgi:signal transduction histidine kinase